MSTKDRVRSFSVTFRLSAIGAKALDEKLDAIQNQYFEGNKSRNQVLQWLLRDSVNLHYERLRQGQGPTQSTQVKLNHLPDPVLVEELAERMEVEQEIHDNLGRMYETLGLDRFVEICEDNDIDWRAFLEQSYTLTAATESTWTEKARRWLDLHLSDGDIYSTDDVHDSAEEEGVVQTDKDWSKLRTIAAREGYASNAPRGYWCKSPSYKNS